VFVWFVWFVDISSALTRHRGWKAGAAEPTG
jgi:hypothetical protein